MPKYLFSFIFCTACLLYSHPAHSGGSDKYGSHSASTYSSSGHSSGSSGYYHSGSSSHSSGTSTHSYPNIYGSSGHSTSGHTSTSGHSSYASTVAHYGLGGIHHEENEKGRVDRFGVPYHQSGSGASSSHKYGSAKEDKAKAPASSPAPIAGPRPPKAKPGQYLPAAPTFLPDYLTQ